MIKPFTRLRTLLSIVLALTVYWFLPESCPEAAKRTAGIFIIAATFWGFEILPHYATSFLIVLLLIFFLDLLGTGLDLDKTGYKMFLIPFSSPVIILFFGSLVLAKALTKYKVDKQLAQHVLFILGNKSSRLLFGLAIITAFLSMFVSNTASTAILLGLVTPLIKQLNSDDPFRKAIILTIPFSANIGGIGTPVGTPPNAIAIGNLSEIGIFLPFGNWMIMAVPLMLILLIINYRILYWLFPPKDPLQQFYTIFRSKLRGIKPKKD